MSDNAIQKTVKQVQQDAGMGLKGQGVTSKSNPGFGSQNEGPAKQKKPQNAIQKTVAEVNQTIKEGKGEKVRPRTINTKYGPVVVDHAGTLTPEQYNWYKQDAEKAMEDQGVQPPTSKKGVWEEPLDTTPAHVWQGDTQEGLDVLGDAWMAKEKEMRDNTLDWVFGNLKAGYRGSNGAMTGGNPIIGSGVDVSGNADALDRNVLTTTGRVAQSKAQGVEEKFWSNFVDPSQSHDAYTNEVARRSEMMHRPVEEWPDWIDNKESWSEKGMNLAGGLIEGATHPFSSAIGGATDIIDPSVSPVQSAMGAAGTAGLVFGGAHFLESAPGKAAAIRQGVKDFFSNSPIESGAVKPSPMDWDTPPATAAPDETPNPFGAGSKELGPSPLDWNPGEYQAPEPFTPREPDANPPTRMSNGKPVYSVKAGAKPIPEGITPEVWETPETSPQPQQSANVQSLPDVSPNIHTMDTAVQQMDPEVVRTIRGLQAGITRLEDLTPDEVNALARTTANRLIDHRNGLISDAEVAGWRELGDELRTRLGTKDAMTGATVIKAKEPAGFEERSSVNPEMAQRDVPEEPHGLPEGQTGISNRIQEDLVHREYLNSVVSGKGLTQEEMNAMIREKGARIDAGELNPEALADEIANKGKALNEDDLATIQAANRRYHARTNGIKAQIDAAIAAGEVDRIPELQKALLKSIEDHTEFAAKIQAGKTRWSNVGRLMAQMVDEDIDTFSGMLKRAEHMAGEKITPESHPEIYSQIETLSKNLDEAKAKIAELEGSANKSPREYMPPSKLELNDRRTAALENELLENYEKIDPESDVYDPALHLALFKHFEGRAPVSDAELYESFYSAKPKANEWFDEARRKYESGELGTAAVENLKEMRGWVDEGLRHPNDVADLVMLRRTKSGGWQEVYGGASQKFVMINHLPEDVQALVRSKAAEMLDSEMRFVTPESAQAWKAAGKPDRMPGFHPRLASEVVGMEGEGLEFFPAKVLEKIRKDLDANIERSSSEGLRDRVRFNENDLEGAKSHYNESDPTARAAQEELHRIRAANANPGGSNRTLSTRERRSVIQSKRADLKKLLAEEWAASAPKDTTIYSDPFFIGITAEKLARLQKVAPRILEIAKTYVDEGAVVLGDVVAKIKKDTDEIGLDLTEREIHGILAGKFNVAAVRERVVSDWGRIKNEARAMIQKDIEASRAKITSLESGISNEKSPVIHTLAQREAKRIDKLRGQIEDLETMIRKKEPVEAKTVKGADSPEVAELKAKKADLEKQVEKIKDELGTMNPTRMRVRQLSQKMQDLYAERRKFNVAERELKDLERQRIKEARDLGRKQASQERTEANKEYRQWWRDSIPGQREGMYNRMKRLEDELSTMKTTGEATPKRARPEVPQELRDAYLSAERARVERDSMLAGLRAQAEWAAKTKGQKALANASGVLFTPWRKLLATADMSSAFNQNVWSIFSTPGGWFKSLFQRGAYRALRSPDEMNKIMAELRLHPDYDIAKGVGLKVEADEILHHEQGMIANKVLDSPWTVFKGTKAQMHLNPFAASERAYAVGVAKNRLEMFSRLKNLLEGRFYGNKPLTIDELKALRDYVHIATGRGVGKVAESAGNISNAAGLFAGRFWVSRVQLGLAIPLWKTALTNPKVASLILRDYATATGAILGTVAAFNYFRDPTTTEAASLDPSDTNFLRGKIGNQTIDFSFGIANPMRLMAKFYTRKDPASTVGNQIFGKLAPIPRTFWALKKGNAYGSEYNFDTVEGRDNVFRGLIEPIFFQDAVDIWDDPKMTEAQKIMLTVAALHGVSVYGNSGQSSKQQR